MFYTTEIMLFLINLGLIFIGTEAQQLYFDNNQEVNGSNHFVASVEELAETWLQSHFNDFYKINDNLGIYRNSRKESNKEIEIFKDSIPIGNWLIKKYCVTSKNETNCMEVGMNQKINDFPWKIRLRSEPKILQKILTEKPIEKKQIKSTILMNDTIIEKDMLQLSDSEELQRLKRAPHPRNSMEETKVCSTQCDSKDIMGQLKRNKRSDADVIGYTVDDIRKSHGGNFDNNSAIKLNDGNNTNNDQLEESEEKVVTNLNENSMKFDVDSNGNITDKNGTKDLKTDRSKPRSDIMANINKKLKKNYKNYRRPENEDHNYENVENPGTDEEDTSQIDGDGMYRSKPRADIMAKINKKLKKSYRRPENEDHSYENVESLEFNRNKRSDADVIGGTVDDIRKSHGGDFDNNSAIKLNDDDNTNNNQLEESEDKVVTNLNENSMKFDVDHIGNITDKKGKKDLKTDRSKPRSDIMANINKKLKKNYKDYRRPENEDHSYENVENLGTDEEDTSQIGDNGMYRSKPRSDIMSKINKKLKRNKRSDADVMGDTVDDIRKFHGGDFDNNSAIKLHDGDNTNNDQLEESDETVVTNLSETSMKFDVDRIGNITDNGKKDLKTDRSKPRSDIMANINKKLKKNYKNYRRPENEDHSYENVENLGTDEEDTSQIDDDGMYRSKPRADIMAKINKKLKKSYRRPENEDHSYENVENLGTDEEDTSLIVNDGRYRSKPRSDIMSKINKKMKGQRRLEEDSADEADYSYDDPEINENKNHKPAIDDDSDEIEVKQEKKKPQAPHRNVQKHKVKNNEDNSGGSVSDESLIKHEKKRLIAIHHSVENRDLNNIQAIYAADSDEGDFRQGKAGDDDNESGGESESHEHQKKIALHYKHGGKKGKHVDNDDSNPSKSVELPREEGDEYDWHRCTLPKKAKNAEILCKKWNTAIACNLFCAFGHTFPEGIKRTIACKYSEGHWSGKFEECKPFVDCSVQLTSAGTLNCVTNRLKKGNECEISCDRSGKKGSISKKKYTCSGEGRWTPALPHCVESEGIDVLEPPGEPSHGELAYPSKYPKSF